MADNKLYLELQLNIPKSVSNIKKQVQDLSKIIDARLNIKAGLDPKSYADYKKMVSELWKEQSAVQKAMAKSSSANEIAAQKRLDSQRKASEAEENYQRRLTARNQANNEIVAQRRLVAIQRAEQAEAASQRRLFASNQRNNEIIAQRRLINAERTADRERALAQRVANFRRQMELRVNYLTGSSAGRFTNNQEVNTFRQSLSQITTPQGMVEARLEFQRINNAAQLASRSSLNLGESLRQAFTKFPLWMAVSTAFMQTFNAIRDGVKYVYELDNALNQIRIVTGNTQHQVESLAMSYNKLAQQMGVTTNEIAKTSVELYRQGLSQQEVETRMKAIIQYAKISNISLEQSSKIITATANATGESVTKIIDIFALLGDKTASGADEIGTALQKVAGTAESMGVSIEQASAWIATISSKTRESASVIGNSLKSMMSRYAQIKEKGFNEEDATNINQVTKALKQAGVVASDQSGQLRNAGEVITELMGKWKGLDENTKRYIATTLGGTFQMNRLLVLLENSDDAFQNYEYALNSAGTAQKKFDIYQESSQTKLDKLTAAFEGFWMKSFNASTMKNILGALTDLIKLLNNLWTTLSTLGALMLIFKSKWISDMVLGFIALTKQTFAFKTTVDGTVVAMSALQKATVIIGIITTIISALNIATEHYNRTVDEQISKSAEQIEKYNEEKKSIDGIIEKYKDLTSTGEKTKETKLQLKSLQTQLNSIFGDEAEKIDLVNGGYEKQIGLIQELQTKKLEKAYNEGSSGALLAESSLNKKVYQVNNPFENLPIDNGAGRIADLVNKYKIGYTTAFGSEIKDLVNDVTKQDLSKMYQSILKDAKELKDITVEEYNALNKLAEVKFTEDGNPFSSKTLSQISESVLEYEKVVNSFKAVEFKRSNNSTIQSAEREIIKLKSLQEQITNPKPNANFAKLNEDMQAQKKIVEDYRIKLQGLSKDSDEAKNYLKEMFDLPEMKENFATELTLDEELKKLNATIEDDSTKALKQLNQLVYDLGEGEKLTAEEVQEVIKQNPELVNSIKQVADGYIIERDALVKRRDELVKNKNETLTQQAEMTKATALQSIKRMEIYSKEFSTLAGLISGIDMSKPDELDNVIKKQKTITGKAKNDLITKKLSGQGVKVNLKTMQGLNLASSFLVNDEDLKKLNQENNIAENNLNTLKSTIGEINKLKETFNDSKLGVSTNKDKSSSGSPKSETQEAYALLEVDRYMKLNNALADNNALLEENKAHQEIADIKEKLKLLEEENKILDKRRLLLIDIANEQRKEKMELINKLSKKGVNFEGQDGENLLSALASGKLDGVVASNFEKVDAAKVAKINELKKSKMTDVEKEQLKKLEDERKDFKALYDRFLEVTPSIKKLPTDLAKNKGDKNSNLATSKELRGKLEEESLDKVLQKSSDHISFINEEYKKSIDRQTSLVKFSEQYNKETAFQLNLRTKEEEDLIETNKKLEEILKTSKDLTEEDKRRYKEIIDANEGKIWDNRIDKSKQALDLAREQVELEKQRAEQIVKIKQDELNEQDRLKQIDFDNKEKKLKKDILQLDKDIFYVSRQQFNDFQQSKISQIESELATLRTKEQTKDVVDEITAKERLLTLERNAQYDTITDFKSLYQEINKSEEDKLKLQIEEIEQQGQYYLDQEKDLILQKIKLDLQANKITMFDDELNKLSEMDKLKDKDLERLQKQIELEKQRQKVANIEKERNTKMLVDGKWQWVANPETLREAKESLIEMEIDYARYERDAQYEADKEKIQAEIDRKNDVYSIREDTFKRESEMLEGSLQKEKDTWDEIKKTRQLAIDDALREIDVKYQDMDKLTRERLATIQSTVGTSWDAIINYMTTGAGNIDKVFSDMKQKVLDGVVAMKDGINSVLGAWGGGSSSGGTTSTGSSGSGSVSTSSNGISYQGNVDYAGIIDANPNMSKEERNKNIDQRNAKIDDMNISDSKKTEMKDQYKKYANGGLNTSTGFHWMDGTENNPELVLNPKDTQNMLNMVKITRDMSNIPLSGISGNIRKNIGALSGKSSSDVNIQSLTVVTNDAKQLVSGLKSYLRSGSNA